MEGVRNKRNDADWVERVRERLNKGFYDSQAFREEAADVLLDSEAFWRKGNTSPDEAPR
jgi:hypothetical protein|tara:strand:- start:756 stop:932 length:177 start_codon:yes stop_codon:yes gene_type:complete